MQTREDVEISADEILAMLHSEPVDLPERENFWPQQGEWTYDDYLRLPNDGRRYEIIEGVLYVSPAPKYRHQFAAGALFALLWHYVRERGLGVVLAAPFEVYLSERIRPLQPDIIFLRAEVQPSIDASGFDGIPDLAVEILSPSSIRRDRFIKFAVYENAGVPEYWIVDPETRSVEVYVWRNGLYELHVHAVGGAAVTSTLFPELALRVDELFPSAQTGG
jgi:Uma2 family endonuclease